MASTFPFALYFDSPVTQEEYMKVAQEKYGKEKKGVIEYRSSEGLVERTNGGYAVVITKFIY